MATTEKYWTWDGNVLTYAGEYDGFTAAHEAATSTYLWMFSESCLRVLKDEVEKALAPPAKELGT